MALKFDTTGTPPCALLTPLISIAVRPDGRFIGNLMYGRWMFDRASSVVCSRSTSLRRDCTWLDRVPAEKRAMKSFSCAIFFSRCALSDSIARADLRLGEHHVVVAAGVGDDRLVVDVGDVRADRVQEMAVVRDDDERARRSGRETRAASGSSRGRDGSSARRAAAPAGWPKSACASRTRTFCPPCSSAIVRSCSASGMSRPWSRIAASLSAV